MSDNSSNNKRIAKNTILLYFRMLIMMAVTLYTSRVVLATLGVEDFGIYNVVGGVVMMFAFLNGTISGVTQRYITYELGTGNKKNLQVVFNTSMCIHWLIAFIILLLAETIGLWFVLHKLVIPEARMTAAIWVYQFSILSTIVLIVSIPYNACIIAHERMSAFAYISIVEVMLKLLVVYLLLLSDGDKLILYAFLIFTVQLLIRFVYTIYCKRHFEESRYKLSMDKALTKKMMGFTGWSLFGGFASVGMTQGVNILLNLFFGPLVNAARAIAVQVESAIMAFSTNFQMALNPQIIKNYASGNLIQMQKLVYASCRYSYYLLFALSMPIFIEANFILHLWLTNVPEHSVSLVRYTLLIMMIDCMAKPIMTAANATGNIKRYQTVVGTLMLLIIPISYVMLLVIEKPEIVFVVYLSLVIISLFVRLWIVKDLLGLSVAWFLNIVLKPVMLVTIASVIAPALCYSVIVNELLQFAIVTTVSIASSLLSIYYIGINDDERNLVKYYMKKLFKYGNN